MWSSPSIRGTASSEVMPSSASTRRMGCASGAVKVSVMQTVPQLTARSWQAVTTEASAAFSPAAVPSA
jgi:hypothetical protein